VTCATRRGRRRPPASHAGLEGWAANDGDGEPVLLLHGGEGPAGPELLHALSARRVLAPPLPGIGTGELPEGWTSVVDYADWIAALMGQVDLGPVDVVGHSFGAYIASILLGREPALFRRVVLSAPMGAVVDGIKLPDPINLTPAERARLIGYSSFDPDAPLPPQRVVAGRTLGRMVGQNPFDADLIRRLRGIDVAALVVRGAEDLYLPRSYCSAYADSLQAEYVEIDGAGHALPHLAPQALATVVLDFLGRA
jgi:pimeloyl-ACP methyl ester carboxylesterase